jgi:hypothetical protein
VPIPPPASGPPHPCWAAAVGESETESLASERCLYVPARMNHSTGFGVEATNHILGSATQIEVRGRDGSTSHLWMGRAPAGVQEGTSYPKKFAAPRCSGGASVGGDGEPSSRSSPALVPPCVTAGVVPPSHPTRVAGPRSSWCRSRRSPTQPRTWRTNDDEIRREQVTDGGCSVTVR